MTGHPFTEKAAEDAIRTIEATLRDLCQRNGLTGVSADQFSFVAAMHAMAGVAARVGLPVDYVIERITEMVPRAMAAYAADEAIDFANNGGMPS